MQPVTGKAIDLRLEELKAADGEYVRLAALDETYAHEVELAKKIMGQAMDRRSANLSLLSARRRELWSQARTEVQGQAS